MLRGPDDVHQPIITMSRPQPQESCPISGRTETELTGDGPISDFTVSPADARAMPEIPDCGLNVR
jgi:hypothetical protein